MEVLELALPAGRCLRASNPALLWLGRRRTSLLLQLHRALAVGLGRGLLLELSWGQLLLELL